MALAVQRRYLTVSPCNDVKLPKKQQGTEILFLEAHKVRALAEAIDPRWRVAVYVAAYGGLRAGEQWALRRRDVDLLRGELVVERALNDIGGKLEFGPTKTH